VQTKYVAGFCYRARAIWRCACVNGARDWRVRRLTAGLSSRRGLGGRTPWIMSESTPMVPSSPGCSHGAGSELM
jgi:hypothetical protein